MNEDLRTAKALYELSCTVFRLFTEYETSRGIKIKVFHKRSFLSDTTKLSELIVSLWKIEYFYLIADMYYDFALSGDSLLYNSSDSLFVAIVVFSDMFDDFSA